VCVCADVCVGVHVRRVVSQLDVLAHPKVALFVSHCGTTSIFEATLLGVPVMCVPVLPSQSVTGALMLRVGAMASMVDHLSPTFQKDIEEGARCGQHSSLRLPLLGMPSLWVLCGGLRLCRAASGPHASPSPMPVTPPPVGCASQGHASCF
jgi:hypothetical protein